MKNQFGLFDGGWGRVGKIWLEDKGHCDLCGANDVPVICSDGSDEEYNYARICKKCADNMFNPIETTRPAQVIS